MSARVTLPAEGEVGVVDIGPLTLENGEVLDDVSIAVQRWGELSPHPRQRGGGPARAHRRLAHPGLVGRGGRPGRTDRHQPLVCGGHQRAGWLSRLHRTQLTGPRRQAVGFALSADHRARPGGRRRRGAGRAGHHRGRRGHRWVDGRRPRPGVDGRLPRAGAGRAGAGRRRAATADQIGTQSTQIAAIKSDPDWQGGDYHGTGRSPDDGLAAGPSVRASHLSRRGGAGHPVRQRRRRATRIR